MVRSLRTADGRQVVYETWGDPNGYPVFFLHGTPGSRLGPRPRNIVLYRLGIRLIAYDRPGYGDSTRLEGREVAHCAADVMAIADSLSLPHFSVVGRSGGGPHALACAALRPDRVRSAAVLVSLAPHDAEGLNWFEGMTASNVREYRSVLADPDGFTAAIVETAHAIRSDPGRLLSDLEKELCLSDRRVVADAGIRRMLLRNYEVALQDAGQKAAGWIDDAISFCKPWGFDPSNIRVPVLLWHGEDDRFSPMGHFRWLAERIPGATAVVQPSAAHFAAVPVLPEVLAWLRRHPGRERGRDAVAHVPAE